MRIFLTDHLHVAFSRSSQVDLELVPGVNTCMLNNRAFLPDYRMSDAFVAPNFAHSLSLFRHYVTSLKSARTGVAF